MKPKRRGRMGKKKGRDAEEQKLTPAVLCQSDIREHVHEGTQDYHAAQPKFQGERLGMLSRNGNAPQTTVCFTKSKCSGAIGAIG